jgi:hypothetical protein
VAEAAVRAAAYPALPPPRTTKSKEVGVMDRGAIGFHTEQRL